MWVAEVLGLLDCAKGGCLLLLEGKRGGVVFRSQRGQESWKWRGKEDQWGGARVPIVERERVMEAKRKRG